MTGNNNNSSSINRSKNNNDNNRSDRNRGRTRLYVNEEASFYRSWAQSSASLTHFGPPNDSNPNYTQLWINILRAQRSMRLDSPVINPRASLRISPITVRGTQWEASLRSTPTMSLSTSNVSD